MLLPSPVGAQTGVPCEQRVPDDLVDAGPGRHRHPALHRRHGLPPAASRRGSTTASPTTRSTCSAARRRLPGRLHGHRGRRRRRADAAGVHAPAPGVGRRRAATTTCFPPCSAEQTASCVYEWGMGTDDFLREGEDLELFSTDTFSDGSPRHGVDRRHLRHRRRVGRPRRHRRHHGARDGRLGDPGAGRTRMFWGSVDGDLAMAVDPRTRPATCSRSTCSRPARRRSSARCAEPGVQVAGM